MGTTATIDQGNTSAKITIYRDGELVERARLGNTGSAALAEILDRQRVRGAIYSSVGRFDAGLVGWLRHRGDIRVLVLSHTTPLPVRIAYTTPQTLGLDRVAAAIGAWSRWGGEPLVVADAGTALTVDMVSADGTFLGGNISPGLHMRLESLHRFTRRLPRVELDGPVPDYGHDTETALRCGALLGAAREIAGACRHASRVVLTGGDAPLLAPIVREETDLPTDCCDHLVADGLLRIYEYNETI